MHGKFYLLSGLVTTPTAGGIYASTTFSANIQSIHGIYLRTIARGQAISDTGDLHVIWTLAHSCPLAAGDAVYMARSLHSLYFPLEGFDDGLLCSALPDSTKKLVAKAPKNTEKAEVFAQVIPNPATNNASVLYYGGGAVNRVNLYDNLGEIVLSKTDQLNTGRIDLDLVALPTGIYIVKVTSDGHSLLNTKLVVVK